MPGLDVSGECADVGCLVGRALTGDLDRLAIGAVDGAIAITGACGVHTGAESERRRKLGNLVCTWRGIYNRWS